MAFVEETFKTVLKDLEQQILAINNNPHISFNYKNKLGLNDFIYDIQHYFDLDKYINKDVKNHIQERILQIIEKSNIQNIIIRLKHFLPYFLDFLIQCEEKRYKNMKIINVYIVEILEAIQFIRKVLDEIIIEIERTEYTLEITGDYGLLQAFEILRVEKNVLKKQMGNLSNEEKMMTSL